MFLCSIVCVYACVNHEDYDDLLDKSELGKCLRSLGLAPTNKEVNEYETALEGKGVFNLEHLYFVCADFIAKHLNDKPMDDRLREAFDAIDRESTGSIPAAELKHVLRSIGGIERLSKDEVEALYKKHNVTEDSNLDYQSFCKLFTIQDPFGLYQHTAKHE